MSFIFIVLSFVRGTPGGVVTESCDKQPSTDNYSTFDLEEEPLEELELRIGVAPFSECNRFQKCCVITD
jgi:hypothetical protein